MDDEVWRDITDYEDYYQVSNLGNVKRCEHYSYHLRGKGHYFKLPEKIVRQEERYDESRNYRYRVVTLCKDGKSKTFLIHRLVAVAFIPNPENKPQVNHIDGNPCNNNLSNLEWVTGSENMQHAIRTGLYSTDKSRQAGMTHAKPVRCLETGQMYVSQSEAARMNNISLEVVQNSVKYKRPGRCGLTFELVDNNDKQDFSRFRRHS